MRAIGIAAVTASLVLMTAHAPARAEQVCIGLTAEVTFVRDDAGILGGDVQVGDTISGCIATNRPCPMRPRSRTPETTRSGPHRMASF